MIEYVPAVVFVVILYSPVIYVLLSWWEDR
jgi:hypothetical protein